MRCRIKKETGAEDGFELAGTITEVERDLLIEILFERYGDSDISLKNFLRNFGELKNILPKNENDTRIIFIFVYSLEVTD